MKYPKDFEYRAGLLDVLDHVHRQTIARAMARVGIKLEDNSWESLDKYNNELHKRYPEVVPSTVEYSGDHSFGPILGKPHRLVESRPTDYITEKTLNENDKRRQMEIHIQETMGPSLHVPSRILFLPDSPPVAVHGNDYNYTKKQYNPRVQLSDNLILKSITTCFGPGAMDFISEDAAKSLTYALLHDETEVAES